MFSPPPLDKPRSNGDGVEMDASCDCGITEPHVHPPYLGLVGMLMGYQGVPILQNEERARLLGVIATRCERRQEDK